MLFILVKPVLKIGNPKLRAPLQPQSWEWNHPYDEAFYEAHREEVCFNPPRKFSHYVGNWWGFGALIVAHESQKAFFSHFEIDLQYICEREKELLLKMPSLIFVKKNRGGAKPGVFFNYLIFLGDTKYPGFEFVTTADSDACTDKDEIL